MIKITFLVRDESSSIPALKEITGEEWYAITQKNKNLPPLKRRYFIYDSIVEGGVTDILIMETSYEEHLKWHEENRRRRINNRAKEAMQFYSLDAEAEIDKSQLMGDAIVDPDAMEEQVIDALAVESLKNGLASWTPWARELFECYQRGEKRNCTKQLAEKYEVCDFTVRRWKKEFEKYCKNFFEK